MRKLSYRDVRRFVDFEDRFNYLKLSGQVGQETFGFDRWMNQAFYTSREWRRARRDILARDLGCDLGVPGHEIYTSPIIHHINPMTPEQIEAGDPAILDPDNLITVSELTHKAIHFGDFDMLPKPYVPRSPGDTVPWRR